MKNQQGFTIVELVTVMILIGILAVSILPKIDGTSSYEPYTFRAQLISALRLTQQRAMQQTSDKSATEKYCHHIVIETSRYGIPVRFSTNCSTTTFPSGWEADATGEVVDDRYNIKFDIDNNLGRIGFDDMGRPQDDCSGGCQINITQTDTSEKVSIKIESEGYIHAI